MSKQLAIKITEWHKDDLEGAAVAEVPVPVPQAGEALVRITLRPVNPTDLVTLHGARAATIKLPAIPGSEGIVKLVRLVCFGRLVLAWVCMSSLTLHVSSSLFHMFVNLDDLQVWAS